MTAFERLDERRFVGHALDPTDLARRLVVEVVVDDEPVALLRAERFDRRLLDRGFSDGCYGFVYAADGKLLDGARRISARVANHEVAVGGPLDFARDAVSPDARATRTGTVSWTAGLRLFGRAPRPDESGADCVVRVREGGVLVAEHRPPRWAPVRGGGSARDECPFALHLPASLADGQVHRLRIEDRDGCEFEGSPVAMLAFPGGLADALAPDAPGDDTVRAEWADQLFPGSVPFARYPAWKAALPASVIEPRAGPVRIVVVGETGLDDTLDGLRRQAVAGWSAAAVSAERGAVAPDDLIEAVTADLGDAEVALFMSAGTTLEPGALAALADALRDAPDAHAVYPDIEIATESGPMPIFFGAFDYERQLEQGYAAHLFAARIGPVREALRARPDSLPRLLLALLDRPGGADRILHRPGCLASLPRPPLSDVDAVRNATRDHLAARRIPATLEVAAGSIFPALHVRRTCARELVSIVIPTRDRVDLLERCVASIHERSEGVDYEIVVVDNGSVEPATEAFFRSVSGPGCRIVRCPGPFNFSRLVNRGVAAARGDLVCLLNNDVEVLTGSWLAELQSRLADPEVGAVGAVLTWPNGMVQHGGIVLGPGFSAADAFNDRASGDPGYGDLLRVAHEASAVTGACLMVRGVDCERLGGFDELAFPVLFNDVDFCLRLRAEGRRIVVTPHLQLLHHESASRGVDASPSRRSRYHRELSTLRSRWGEILAADPFYSPYLNTDAFPFSALASPPRTRIVPNGSPGSARG